MNFAAFNSKAIIVLFATALFASFAALWSLDPGAYLAIMRYWIDIPQPAPFGDAAFVIGQLECWRAGVDVYLTNTCDIYHRVNVYSPLWLRLWFLPAGRQAIMPFGAAIVACFIASLAVLPKIERKSGIVLLLIALASPPVAYGVERGNIDLLMFAFAALAIICLDGPVLARVAGYALIMLAALLKLYPAVLLVLLLRERPKFANALAICALVVLGAFAFGWHDELIQMFRNIPQPAFHDDGLGGSRLADGLVQLGDRLLALFNDDATAAPVRFYAQRGAVMGLVGLLTLGFAALARWLARPGALPDAFAALNQREQLCFVAGGALFCGCFITGNSVVYRETLLLFALPALFRFQHVTSLPGVVRITGWIAVGLMWSVPLGDAVQAMFGDMTDAVWHAPSFAFWIAREVLWWWVFAVMVSGLICFARLARGEHQAISVMAAPTSPLRLGGEGTLGQCSATRSAARTVSREWRSCSGPLAEARSPRSSGPGEGPGDRAVSVIPTRPVSNPRRYLRRRPPVPA